MAKTVNSIKDFKTLKVWQKSKELTNRIYEITQKFPTHEQYVLTTQIRRSCASIGANIAEGNGQLFPNKQIQFLSISLGSVAETRNWLDLAKECGYISEEDFVELDEKCTEITKMLLGYVKSVRKQIENSNIE